MKFYYTNHYLWSSNLYKTSCVKKNVLVNERTSDFFSSAFGCYINCFTDTCRFCIILMELFFLF